MKIIKSILLSVLFVPLLAFAHQPEDTAPHPHPEVVLPGAGLTPNSPFYFLEQTAEALREFITFNPQAKANLQAERALERIAEIKAMLAEKEVKPTGLAVAFGKLQANIAKATEIVEKENKKGKDATRLAKDLDTDFEIRERLLKDVLEEKEDQLELEFKQQKNELKQQLIDAKLAGETQKIGEIVLALDKLEQDKETQELLLEQEEEELEAAFEAEEEKFELVLDQQEREFELKERGLELDFEKKERELKRQFKEAKAALALKDDELDKQFDIALSLQDQQAIDDIKAQFAALLEQENSLDGKLAISEANLDDVENKLELLILQEERQLKDFFAQEELALEATEREIEASFDERKFVEEQQFKALENTLELKEKQLKFQIAQAQQSGDAQKVAQLNQELFQVKSDKLQVEFDKEAAEKALELEEEKFEQELELKEKELEILEEQREKALELKEEELEKEVERLEKEQDRQEEEEERKQDELEDAEQERTDGNNEDDD